MAPYLEASRQVRRSRRVRRIWHTQHGLNGLGEYNLTFQQRATIRHWAREQDYPVGQRGRIPREIIAEYFGEHPRPRRR